MANQRDYIFECFMSITSFLQDTLKDITLKNVQLNHDVIEAIEDLENEDYFNNRNIDIHINDITNHEEVEFILNKLIHEVYINCEFQRLIKKNLEIDNLVREYETKEQECLNLKNKIVNLHNTRL